MSTPHQKMLPILPPFPEAYRKKWANTVHWSRFNGSYVMKQRPTMTLTNPRDPRSLPVETTYASDSSIARHIALQTLYEVDLAGHPALPVLARHLQAQEPPPRAARLARELVAGVDAHRPVIDSAIAERAPDHPVATLAAIDRNILRIALFEFAVSRQTPTGVAIDEAVELAKAYAAEGAPGFINGVLRVIANDPRLLERLAQPAEREG